MKRDVIIIGGGLAGLVSAILLARNGISATVLEKKTYPAHKVCGEYVSNEVVPFLQGLDLYPGQFKPPEISRFLLSSISGNPLTTDLGLGGFGISRYNFDNFLFEKAREAGVEIFTNTAAETVIFNGNEFEVRLSKGDTIYSALAIGAYGKKSRLDRILDRDFTHRRSPFLGVKYHIEYDFPGDLIALHNFEGGYCGIVKIENGKCNLCYLASRDILKRTGTITDMEQEVLCRNPYLSDIFSNADFLFGKPIVINEFSFEAKKPVENHILMAGDSAGLITPLCGNGMAMAIHSGKLAAEAIINHFNNGNPDLVRIEKEYASRWNGTFRQRLWVGRQIQNLLGGKNTSEFAVRFLKKSQAMAKWIIKYTHGEPF
jgi:flavin-dependent dehydrogenase